LNLFAPGWDEYYRLSVGMRRCSSLQLTRSERGSKIDRWRSRLTVEMRTPWGRETRKEGDGLFCRVRMSFVNADGLRSERNGGTGNFCFFEFLTAFELDERLAVPS
jgi:hypothetical protein